MRESWDSSLSSASCAGSDLQLARHLLNSLAVHGRVVERVCKRPPCSRIDPRFVEPEHLHETRLDHAKPPLTTTAIAKDEGVGFVHRIEARDDTVAVVPPAAIHEPPLTGPFLHP